MEYTVHFMGYYGYDVDVEADNEEEAKEKARVIYDEVDANQFFFEEDGVDVWEREIW